MSPSGSAQSITQSNAKPLRVPLETELGGRSHVSDESGRSNDCGTREVSLAAVPHSVLPVAIERRNGPLSLLERIRPLPKTGPAPGAPDFPADGTKDIGDRLTLKTFVRLLDLALDAARSREDDELLHGFLDSSLTRRAQHQSGREEVVVAAVRARPDQRLVKRDPLARDLFRRKGVAGAEGLGNHRGNLAERELLVDLEHGVFTAVNGWIREIGHAF